VSQPIQTLLKNRQEVRERFPEIPFEGDFSPCLVWEGDTHLDGSLDYDFASELGEICAIIVTGSLTVQGDVELYDYHPALWVQGDLVAESLQAGDCEIVIDGDARIAHLVYGYYNDGTLRIHGTTHTPLVINSDHCTEITPAPSATLINAYSNYDDFFTYDYYSDDLEGILAKGLYDTEKEKIKLDALLEACRKKKAVFKKGAQPARKIIQKKLDALVAKGEQPTLLDLRGERIKGFPKQILKLTSLRQLLLDNLSIDSLPDQIGQLAALEELSLKNCSLESLPASIAKLQNLRILDVSGNPDLRLSDEIGCLSNLRILRYAPRSLHLPDTLDQIATLEELDLSGGDEREPVALPPIVGRCKALHRLSLRHRVLTSFPQALLQLPLLEELNLGAGPLCFLTEIPDLSSMTSLKKLDADGLTTYSYRPYPKQDLIKAFFHLPNLEALSIDRHGEEKDYNPQSQQHEITREALQSHHLEGIGKLKKLRVLDLSFNGLESLPDEIFSLPLEEIDLRYNKLSSQERKRIAKHFPKARIDFRHNPQDPVNDPALLALRERRKEAQSLENPKEGLRALALYDEILQQIAEASIANEYEILYTHYRRMWLLSQLGYQWRELPTAEREIHKALCAEAGKRCLALVPQSAMLWHFDDLSAFYREVMRFSANAVAWFLYEEAKTPSEYEEALVWAEKGLSGIELDQENHLYLLDTQARILLALQRDEDAYAIAERVLARHPKFKDFQDISKSAAFKKWKKKRASSVS
jgi:Leucine-rich repeat (LRR) protein